MDTPKTMAMKITKNNWSVAAAMCPDLLSRKHQKNYFGQYLVINIPECKYDDTGWFGLVLSKKILDEIAFNTEYSFMPGMKLKNRFVEVEQIIRLERPHLSPMIARYSRPR